MSNPCDLFLGSLPMVSTEIANEADVFTEIDSEADVFSLVGNQIKINTGWPRNKRLIPLIARHPQRVDHSSAPEAWIHSLVAVIIRLPSCTNLNLKTVLTRRELDMYGIRCIE